MQQVQDQLSVMPAFMAMKLMGGAFRGLAPVLVIASAAAAGGLVYGAVKSGQCINKYIQKVKPGDNAGGKLLRDLEKQNLVYQSGKMKGQPIPVSELVTHYKMPEKYYKDFERIAKKSGLPYSAVDYKLDKNSPTTEREIMIMKKHDGIMRKGLARTLILLTNWFLM